MPAKSLASLARRPHFPQGGSAARAGDPAAWRHARRRAEHAAARAGAKPQHRRRAGASRSTRAGADGKRTCREAAPSGAFTPAQRKEIEAIIKDILLNNPEVLLEAQNALEAKMDKIQAERMAVAIKENAASSSARPARRSSATSRATCR